MKIKVTVELDIETTAEVKMNDGGISSMLEYIEDHLGDLDIFFQADNDEDVEANIIDIKCHARNF